MTIIAQNPFYSLIYDDLKNRLFFRMTGYWRKPEDIPDYLKDWGRAVKLTKPGFTLLGDVSEMLTHPAAISALHEKAMDLCLIAGVKQVAEVTPRDKIALLQTRSMAVRSSISFKSFPQQSEAEKWLDTLS